MNIRLYMDEDALSIALTRALRSHGIEVITVRSLFGWRAIATHTGDHKLPVRSRYPQSDLIPEQLGLRHSGGSFCTGIARH